MARVSLASLLTSVALAGATFAQDLPDLVLGTTEGVYELFTPAEIVRAADTGVAFRFFEQERLNVAPITTNTTIAASGAGLTISFLPATRYTQGLSGGPFFTVYEGDLVIGLTANRTLNLAVTARHVFEDQTTLSSTRNHTFRANSQNAVSISLTEFSSITELPIGATFKNDNGDEVTITAALLAQAVSIEVSGELTALSAGQRTTATVASLVAETPKVTWYQFLAGRGGGGGGGATPLSNADPAPTGAAPVAGTSDAASRSDHIHSVTLSALTPKAPGTGSPGSGSVPGPWDHVHPSDPDIEVLANDIQTLTDAIPDPSDATPKATGTAAAGSSADYSRADHVHAGSGGGGGGTTPLSDSNPLVAGTAAPGTASEASRGDHVHPIQPLSSFGTVGANGLCAKSDGSGGLKYADCGSPRVLANANPKQDGTAAPGASLQASRGDHVHPSNVGSTVPPHASFATGAAGSSGVSARADHSHALLASLIAPKPDGTAAVGTSIAPARSDHVHPAASRELPAPTGATQGDIPRIKSDGSAYEVVDPHVAVLSGLPAITGQGGKVLTVNAAATGVEWGAGGGGGGGGSSWQLFKSAAFTTTTGTLMTAFTFTTEEKASLLALAKQGVLFGVVLQRRAGGIDFGVAGAGFFKAESDATNMQANIPMDAGTTATSITVHCSVSTLSGMRCRRESGRFIGPGTVLLYYLELGGGGGGGDTPSIPAPSGASNYLRVNAAGNAYELGALPFSDVIPQASTGTLGFAGVLNGIARPDHRHKRDADTIANTAAIAGKASVGSFTPLVAGTATAGSSNHASREDHVHPAQAIPLSDDTPKADGAGTAGSGTEVSRSDHVHPLTSGFVAMLDGEWTLNNNNVDYSINNAGLHNILKASDAPKMMFFIIRYTSGGVNYAYQLTCPGADTPLGSTESRTFMCLGWRERTDSAIEGQIDVSPSGYRIKVENIDARDNQRVNFRLWGLR